MSISITSFSMAFPELSTSHGITCSTSLSTRYLLPSSTPSQFVLCGNASNFCRKFRGLKLWIFKNLNIRHSHIKFGPEIRSNTGKSYEKDCTIEFQRITASHEEHMQAKSKTKDSVEDTSGNISHYDGSNNDSIFIAPGNVFPSDGSFGMKQTDLSDFSTEKNEASCLSIAIIGATGDLARRKIFPALFALYYSGFLPESFAIFGYSRRNLTDGDLRSLIASTLTCRLDHQEDCESKIETFLSKTHCVYGDYDNQKGMSKLNAKLEQTEGKKGANRIFYLSVPQEAVSYVACSISDKAQTKRGWNRIIIEKPFGFNLPSSHSLTKLLHSKYEENQIYRIDHLLGRNLIENLTVLRFSNLVFEPLWSRKYVRNVQVILSEELDLQTPSRYLNGYGVIRDMVQSHILQTVALLAMEPPISLDGEDIRNEKVKVLRSIGRLQPADVILGQYKARVEDKVNISLTSTTPTFFAAALYINNARWDGVPFMIRAGTGLTKHRMEIRIQFNHVPGNIYRARMGQNIDLATNELILQDVPNEAILIKVNNKVPGLSLHLDTSELNLLYKDKYNSEVLDSYEHLIHDVIDGDNHLFMRSDEVDAAWNILTPILQEIDKKNISPELYELSGRGPVGAYYLWAKHGVGWVDD